MEFLINNLGYILIFIVLVVGLVGVFAVHTFEKKYKIYEEAVRRNNLIIKEKEHE